MMMMMRMIRFTLSVNNFAVRRLNFQSYASEWSIWVAVKERVLWWILEWHWKKRGW